MINLREVFSDVLFRPVCEVFDFHEKQASVRRRPTVPKFKVNCNRNHPGNCPAGAQIT